jgi:hypothetical protein
MRPNVILQRRLRPNPSSFAAASVATSPLLRGTQQPNLNSAPARIIDASRLCRTPQCDLNPGSNESIFRNRGKQATTTRTKRLALPPATHQAPPPHRESTRGHRSAHQPTHLHDATSSLTSSQPPALAAERPAGECIPDSDQAHSQV